VTGHEYDVTAMVLKGASRTRTDLVDMVFLYAMGEWVREQENEGCEPLFPRFKCAGHVTKANLSGKDVSRTKGNLRSTCDNQYIAGVDAADEVSFTLLYEGSFEKSLDTWLKTTRPHLGRLSGSVKKEAASITKQILTQLRRLHRQNILLQRLDAHDVLLGEKEPSKIKGMKDLTKAKIDGANPKAQPVVNSFQTKAKIFPHADILFATGNPFTRKGPFTTLGLPPERAAYVAHVVIELGENVNSTQVGIDYLPESAMTDSELGHLELFPKVLE